MPFKIVKTIEDGEEKLCIVPNQWETKGILKYPVKSSDYKLYRDGNSRPSHEWPTMQCQVKRSAIFTYKQANEILNEMMRTSDTDHSVNNTKNNVYVSYKENTADSYNELAEHLILNRQHDESTNTAINNNSVEYEFITPTINNTMPVATASNMQQQQQQRYDNTQIFEVLQANQTILLNVLQVCNSSLENQAILAEKVNALSDNLKKTTHKVIALSLQIDDRFNRLQKTVRESAAVIPLGMSDPDERRSFEMKPVDSVVDLENLESMLSDDSMKKRLTKIYYILCTKSIGNGGTCAYKLLDALFTREFICKCSWSGGSRGKEIKVALKGYQNVLNFFFAMVHSWDETFSVEDNERFFKIVLKNALKRKETKNIRSSSQRKPNLKKQSQVIQTEGKNFTKIIKDKKGTQNKDDAVSITEKYIIKPFEIKSFEQHGNKRQSFIESGEDNDDIIRKEQNKQMHEDETFMTEELKISGKIEGKNRAKINTKKRKQTSTESSCESDEEKEEQTNENIRKQSKIKRQRGNNKGEIEETTKKQKIYERSNTDDSNEMEEEKNELRDKNIRKQKKVQIIQRQNSKGETGKRAKKQKNDHRSNVESSDDTDEDEDEPKYEHIIKHNKVIKIQRGNNKEKICERAKKRDNDEKSNGETSSFDTDEEKNEKPDEYIIKHKKIKNIQRNNKEETGERAMHRENDERSNAETSYDTNEEIYKQTDRNIIEHKKIEKIIRGNSKTETGERIKNGENDGISNAKSSDEAEGNRNEQIDENNTKHKKIKKILGRNNKEETGERAKKRESDKISNTDSDENDKEINEQTDKNKSSIAEMTDHGEE